MTKHEIIKIISKNTFQKQIDVKLVLETFFEIIKRSLEFNRNVNIRGFGTFTNKKKAKKLVRNLSTNTSFFLEEHYSPCFKPSKIFINRIKKHYELKNETR